MVEGKRGDGTCEGLGNDDEGVKLEGTEHPFKPNWGEDAGGYLRGVRGCGSSPQKIGKDNVKRVGKISFSNAINS